MESKTEKISLERDIKVSICTCGQSKNIPYCDSSHKKYNEENKTHYKSLKISPEKDVELELSSSNWE